MAQVPEGRLQDAFKNTRRVFDGLGRKVTRYEWDSEVLPGFQALGTPGHTPGHTSYMLSSEGARLFIQSDVSNVPALFVRHPGWHAMFDMDADQAEATRRKTYDRVAAEKIPVQGFHFPVPGLATIEKTADGYRETMISEIPGR